MTEVKPTQRPKKRPPIPKDQISKKSPAPTTKNRKKPVVKKRAAAKTSSNSGPRGLNKYFIKSKLNQKVRLKTYRKIRKLIRNDVSITGALDTLYEAASNKGKKPKNPLAVIYDQWRRAIRDGQTFGEAIDGWVPVKDQVLIASGEEAGKLDIALYNAALIQESSKKINSAIKKGLAYPVLLLSMTVGFMYIVARILVPAFADIKPIESFTGAGAQMAGLAMFVDNYMHFVLAGLGALSALVVFSLPRWRGKLRAKLDSFPPYSLYRLSAGSGFLLSISSLIAAGVSIPQGLKIIRKTANPWYRERLDATLTKMGSGRTFGEALDETGLNFPDEETVSEIKVYALLDGFEESLSEIGTENLEESVDKITEQASMMRMAGILLLAVVFIWIASGIFSLQQQVSTAM